MAKDTEKACGFEATDADIWNLAICLAAAYHDVPFSEAGRVLSHREDHATTWTRVARAAFDHPDYLPSIVEARQLAGAHTTDATLTRAGFAVGDVVRATAGRPPMTSMTVIKVDDYSDRYLLEWFTPDGGRHRGTAHSDDIELATPDVPEATDATLTRAGFR